MQLANSGASGVFALLDCPMPVRVRVGNGIKKRRKIETAQGEDAGGWLQAFVFLGLR